MAHLWRICGAAIFRELTPSHIGGKLEQRLEDKIWMMVFILFIVNIKHFYVFSDQVPDHQELDQVPDHQEGL